MRSLLLGDKSQVTGGVAAEDVIVRGHIVGSVRGLRITLQAQSHVEGDIFAQSLAIEQGAYFEGKSRRSDNPLAEIKAPGANGSANSGPIPRVHQAWRLPPRRNSEGPSKGFCVVLLRLPAARGKASWAITPSWRGERSFEGRSFPACG